MPILRSLLTVRACCPGPAVGACRSAHTTTDGVTHPGTNRLARSAAGRPGTPPGPRVSRRDRGASGLTKLLTGKGAFHGPSRAAARDRRADRSLGSHRHLLVQRSRRRCRPDRGDAGRRRPAGRVHARRVADRPPDQPARPGAGPEPGTELVAGHLGAHLAGGRRGRGDRDRGRRRYRRPRPGRRRVRGVRPAGAGRDQAARHRLRRLRRVRRPVLRARAPAGPRALPLRPARPGARLVSWVGRPPDERNRRRPGPQGPGRYAGYGPGQRCLRRGRSRGRRPHRLPAAGRWRRLPAQSAAAQALAATIPARPAGAGPRQRRRCIGGRQAHLQDRRRAAGGPAGRPGPGGLRGRRVPGPLLVRVPGGRAGRRLGLAAGSSVPAERAAAGTARSWAGRTGSWSPSC